MNPFTSLPYVQGTSILRFFHHKHQCYIVAEGSFAGKYGTLPDLSDTESSTLSQSALNLDSALKKTALPKPKLKSWVQRSFEVQAEVHPSRIGFASSKSLSLPSGNSSEQTHSRDDGDISSEASMEPRHEAYQSCQSLLSLHSTLDEDEVVIHDGKMRKSQQCH